MKYSRKGRNGQQGDKLILVLFGLNNSAANRGSLHHTTTCTVGVLGTAGRLLLDKVQSSTK